MLDTVKREFYQGDMIPRHKNFLEMYGILQCDYRVEIGVFLLMEYFPGINLFKYITPNRKVSESRDCVIIHQLLIAVRHLVNSGIMHRDLKQQNILVKADNLQTKIIDYGICTSEPTNTRICGTPVYMCPKILSNTPYNKRVDVWSLGVVIFELLTNGKKRLNNYGSCHTDHEVEDKIKGYTKDYVSTLLDTKLTNFSIPDEMKNLLKVMLNPEYNLNNRNNSSPKMHIQNICDHDNEWMDYLTGNIIERIRSGEDVGYFQDEEYFQKELSVRQDIL